MTKLNKGMIGDFLVVHSELHKAASVTYMSYIRWIKVLSENLGWAPVSGLDHSSVSYPTREIFTMNCRGGRKIWQGPT
jgi:hypothetical protein